MSYFGAQPGKRPAPPEEREEQPQAAKPQGEAGPLFAARLGPQPNSTAGAPSAQAPAPGALPPPCPLCAGPLADERGVLSCRGRCGTRWLADQGGLLDMAALPYGACACCVPPRPLVRGDAGAVCPDTGRVHHAPPAPPAAPTASETHQAIDQALRRNSARVTVNGLFDLD